MAGPGVPKPMRDAMDGKDITTERHQ